MAGKLYIGSDAATYAYLGEQCVYELVTGPKDITVTFSFISTVTAPIYIYSGSTQIAQLSSAPYTFTGHTGDRITWRTSTLVDSVQYRAFGSMTLLDDVTQPVQMVPFYRVTFNWIEPTSSYTWYHYASIVGYSQGQEWEEYGTTEYSHGTIVSYMAGADGYYSVNSSYGPITGHTAIPISLTPTAATRYTVTFRMTPTVLADVPMRITNQSTSDYQDLTGTVVGSYVVYSASLEEGTSWDYEPIGEENYGYYGAALDVGPITANTTADTISCIHLPYTVNIVPTPSNATVTMNGQTRSTMTAYSGDTISWTASATTYTPQSGSFVVTGTTRTINYPVTLTPSAATTYTISFYLYPSTPEVAYALPTPTVNGNSATLVDDDYYYQGHYCNYYTYTAAENTTINWNTGSNSYYTGESGTFVLTGNTAIFLSRKATFEISIPSPTLHTIMINGEEQDSALLPVGSSVTWSVSRTGYLTQSGTTVLSRNTTQEVSPLLPVVTINVTHPVAGSGNYNKVNYNFINGTQQYVYSVTSSSTSSSVDKFVIAFYTGDTIYATFWNTWSNTMQQIISMSFTPPGSVINLTLTKIRDRVVYYVAPAGAAHSTGSYVEYLETYDPGTSAYDAQVFAWTTGNTATITFSKDGYTSKTETIPASFVPDDPIYVQLSQASTHYQLMVIPQLENGATIAVPTTFNYTYNGAASSSTLNSATMVIQADQNTTVSYTMKRNGFKEVTDSFTITGNTTKYETIYPYYLERPLTIKNNGSSNATITIQTNDRSNIAGDISVDIKSSYTGSSESYTNIQASSQTITIAAGKMVEIYTTNYNYKPTYSHYIKISGTGNLVAEGNVASLLSGTSVSNLAASSNITPPTYAFSALFSGCTGLTNVEHVRLPFKTASSNCYSYMFYGCTNISGEAAAMNAIQMGSYSCYYMYYNCYGITSAAILSTVLSSNCFERMFQNCSSLTSIFYAPNSKPSTTYNRYWVSGVSNSGTFNTSGDWTAGTRGVSAVPANWTFNNNQFSPSMDI